jgi:integrase
MLIRRATEAGYTEVTPHQFRHTFSNGQFRVRLSRAVRLRAGRPPVCRDDCDLHRVSDDYRNRLLRRSLERHAGLWEEKT